MTYLIAYIVLLLVAWALATGPRETEPKLRRVK